MTGTTTWFVVYGTSYFSRTGVDGEGSKRGSNTLSLRITFRYHLLTGERKQSLVNKRYVVELVEPEIYLPYLRNCYYREIVHNHDGH